MIDIGGGTTDIAIFKDNIIRHTSVIPFGGNVITDDIKVGCSIIGKQAEALKEKFGSAWPGENKESEIVSIPGLKGREAKEISLKRLSQIIHARVQEILEQVYLELKNYGCEDQNKKLIAGIVLTGGGSKLKHIRQLTEYVTGMDVRIGYSNEHIVGAKAEEISGPEYATSVGLLMKGLEELESNYQREIFETPVINNLNNQSEIEIGIRPEQKKIVQEIEVEVEKPIERPKRENSVDELLDEEVGDKKATKSKPEKKNFFSKWTDKFIQMINETE